MQMAAGQATAAGPIPIIDTHIHLFDPRRPQGVPWPPKDNAKLYMPALPDRYRALTAKHNVKGVIKVEASPWMEDNQWVLDLAAKDTLIVGFVGNLGAPAQPEFARGLERFAKNPIFRGVRYGNLWGSDLSDTVGNPTIAGLKRLAEANLSLDTANQSPALIAATAKVASAIPNLRIVIDHLPQMKVPQGEPGVAYRKNLKELGANPRVYVKLSAILRKDENGNIPLDVAPYRDNLQMIFETFGEDRVLYGSDWPNSDNWRPYDDVIAVAKQFFSGKTEAQREKFFWKNSAKAYQWVKRAADQPSA